VTPRLAPERRNHKIREADVLTISLDVGPDVNAARPKSR
jgi:hypothetical protein